MKREVALWQLHMLSESTYHTRLLLGDIKKDIANKDCMLYDKECVRLLKL